MQDIYTFMAYIFILWKVYHNHIEKATPQKGSLGCLLNIFYIFAYHIVIHNIFNELKKTYYSSVSTKIICPLSNSLVLLQAFTLLAN